MYKTTNEGLPTPMAGLAINKSRIKLYGKTSEVPTYYLQKGQEFQIELFNPTKDTIMAKIFLNGKPIAQGGLVLKPAQRVFLDRYIDVARKFKFDTYEVANTSESRKAIEDNGDFKVEFYKERTPINYNSHYFNGTYFGGTVTTNNINGIGASLTNGVGGNISTNYSSTHLTNGVGLYASAGAASGSLDDVTLDWMDQELSRKSSPEPNKSILRSRSLAKKSIETGRVEAGSSSDQTLETVYMNWEYSPFHTVEYKMMPVSQKVNTVEDIQTKRYCTNCAGKIKSTFKFCPFCRTQV